MATVTDTPAARRKGPPYGAYAGIVSVFAGGLAAAGANDFLQASFAALTSKANELEQRSD